MLKAIRSSVTSASKVDDNEIFSSGGAGADGGSVDGLDASRKTTMSKSQIKNGHLKEPKFLTFGPREAFNRLKQAFTKAPILLYFDL